MKNMKTNTTTWTPLPATRDQLRAQIGATGSVDIYEMSTLRANRILNDIMSRPEAERPGLVRRALHDRDAAHVWYALTEHAAQYLRGYSFPILRDRGCDYDVEGWEAENE